MIRCFSHSQLFRFSAELNAVGIGGKILSKMNDETDF